MGFLEIFERGIRRMPGSMIFTRRIIWVTHATHGLKILINDTEYTEVQLNSFRMNAKGNWSATVGVTIYDHFGLDKHDVLKYQSYHQGFAAWYILQATCYRPFVTKIQFQKTIFSLQIQAKKINENMKLSSAIFVLMIVLIGCHSREKNEYKGKSELPIVKLIKLSWTDTSKTETGSRIASVDYYLVRCEGFDSVEIRAGIDRFAKSSQAAKPCRYPQCNMLYFRATDETNEKNLYADKDLIDRYSMDHDLMFEYQWDHNDLIGVYEYLNGLIINPKATIIIKDVNSSVH